MFYLVLSGFGFNTLLLSRIRFQAPCSRSRCGDVENTVRVAVGAAQLLHRASYATRHVRSELTIENPALRQQPESPVLIMEAT